MYRCKFSPTHCCSLLATNCWRILFSLQKRKAKSELVLCRPRSLNISSDNWQTIDTQSPMSLQQSTMEPMHSQLVFSLFFCVLVKSKPDATRNYPAAAMAIDYRLSSVLVYYRVVQHRSSVLMFWRHLLTSLSNLLRHLVHQCSWTLDRLGWYSSIIFSCCLLAISSR